MKKLILSSLTLSALAVISNVALAQENTTKKTDETKQTVEAAKTDAAQDNTPNTQVAVVSTPTGRPRVDTYLTPEQINQLRKELENKPVTENTITVYGLLQGNANASDSQRTNVPDFQGQHARAGVLVKGGIATGQVEFEFLGNQPLYNPPSTDPVSGSTVTPPTITNAVTLRQAQLTLNALNLKNEGATYTTSVALGGIRVGNASAVAPDAANTTSGYSRQDGIYVQEKMNCGNIWSLNLGVGAFNTLFGTAPGANYLGWGNNAPITMQNFWLSTSLNPSLAYLISMNGTYNFSDARSLNLIGYYGFQNNAPYSVIPTTVQTLGAGNLSEARNVNHTEASLTYNDTNIFGDKGIISGNGVAAWYEREENSKTMLVSGNVYRGFIYSNGLIDDAQVASLYGVGVGADTAKYLTGMIQKGDRFTGSAAYTYVGTSLGAAAALQTYNVSQFSASLGYAVNTFEIAFNGEYSTASTNTFYIDANNNSQNYEVRTYLTAVYVF